MAMLQLFKMYSQFHCWQLLNHTGGAHFQIQISLSSENLLGASLLLSPRYRLQTF